MSTKQPVFTHDSDDLLVLGPVTAWMTVRELTSAETVDTIAAGEAVIPDLTSTDAAASTFIQTHAEAAAMATALEKCVRIPTGTTTGLEIWGIAAESITPGSKGKIITAGLVPQVRISFVDVEEGFELVGDGYVDLGDSERYRANIHTGASSWGIALTSDSVNSGYVVGWMYPRGP